MSANARATCHRSWQAEAIEDGRLEGGEREAFERHARACAICTRAVRALASVREAMEHLPAHAQSPLERRRGRMDLLERADARQTRRAGARGRASARWIAAGGVAALLVLAALLQVTRHARPQPMEAAGAPAPRFDVVELGAVRWTAGAAGAESRARLSDGTLSIHVDHLLAGQRFVLELPDGEIEVRGTRFVTSVGAGHTQRVEVTEGVVALRLHGEPERLLGAGQAWALPVEPTLSATTQATAAVPTATSAPAVIAGRAPSRSSPAGAAPARGAPLRLPGTASVTSGSSAAAMGSSTPAASSARPSGAAAGFAAGIGAFEAGDYLRADALLAQFVHDHPGDSRSEDAAFIRIAVHQRMGDPSGASRLARAYLRDCPLGLRRKEAEKLADPP